MRGTERRPSLQRQVPVLLSQRMRLVVAEPVSVLVLVLMLVRIRPRTSEQVRQQERTPAQLRVPVRPMYEARRLAGALRVRSNLPTLETQQAALAQPASPAS